MGEVISFNAARQRKWRAEIIREREAVAERRNAERRDALRAEYACAGREGEIFADIVASVAEAKEEEKRAAQFVPAYCDPNNETRGAKYAATKSLTSTELAGRIRADIKTAQKNGAIPAGGGVSVRKRSYSGGFAIDVRVTSLPAGFKVWNAAYLLHEQRTAAGFYEHWHNERHSPQWRALAEVLGEIHSAYNRDNSDSMTDYFDRRYYGDVGLDWQLSSRVRSAELAAAQAEEA